MLAGLCIMPAYATEEEPPPMELLEFLAEFETENGGWVDPTELEDMDIPEQEHTNDAQ
jgi:hypothetical protein